MNPVNIITNGDHLPPGQNMHALCFVARAMLAVSAFQTVAGVIEEFEGPILSDRSPDRGSSMCEVR